MKSETENEREKSGKGILALAGAIPADDLERMKIAIEEDCRKVNKNEW